MSLQDCGSFLNGWRMVLVALEAADDRDGHFLLPVNLWGLSLQQLELVSCPCCNLETIDAHFRPPTPAKWRPRNCLTNPNAALQPQHHGVGNRPKSVTFSAS